MRKIRYTRILIRKINSLVVDELNKTIIYFLFLFFVFLPETFLLAFLLFFFISDILCSEDVFCVSSKYCLISRCFIHLPSISKLSLLSNHNPALILIFLPSTLTDTTFLLPHYSIITLLPPLFYPYSLLPPTSPTKLLLKSPSKPSASISPSFSLPLQPLGSIILSLILNNSWQPQKLWLHPPPTCGWCWDFWNKALASRFWEGTEELFINFCDLALCSGVSGTKNLEGSALICLAIVSAALSNMSMTLFVAGRSDEPRSEPAAGFSGGRGGPKGIKFEKGGICEVEVQLCVGSCAGVGFCVVVWEFLLLIVLVSFWVFSCWCVISACFLWMSLVFSSISLVFWIISVSFWEMSLSFCWQSFFMSCSSLRTISCSDLSTLRFGFSDSFFELSFGFFLASWSQKFM
ncbi:unnamed protein product [Moneuplotes crassus]|uniref:Uncharacterized protein n=1 Tax=Euplotes crassus TaxID=5936 RepID=A0AAD1XGL1_EUPCR|nr:unnamed protein product [Moneuplotes crassus]